MIRSQPEPPAKRKKSVLSDEDSDVAEVVPPKKTTKATPIKPTPKAKPRASTSSTPHPKRRRKEESDFEEEEESGDEDEPMEVEEDEPKKKKTPAKPSAAKVKKETPAPKAKASTSASASKKHAAAKGDDEKPGEKKKPPAEPSIANGLLYSWIAAKANKLAGPAAPGSKDIPVGEENCLAGLTFVFTGQLASLARDEAQDLAKRYGGRVTGTPSSKTSYVVLGEDAGPSKLAVIKKHGLESINEDEFLNMIATRGRGELDAKAKKKQEQEEQKQKLDAKEMEERDAAARRAAKGDAPEGAARVVGANKTDPSMQLWTDRYAPQTLKEICGNKGQVEKIIVWLKNWDASVKSGFKRPGKDGSGIFRGLLLSGPPGIGKTTSAHLCAKMAGFVPIELNASDARSKKLVENSTNIANTSLDGWMGGGEATNVAGITITNKSCLIMDEVDGMSAGDRGGVGALAALIRKTKIPIICIANDAGTPKMKPLVNATFKMAFRRPAPNEIRSRIMTIAYKEKMKLPANVVDQLIQGVHSDIRQVLNMMSTWKLSSNTMDFDESKALSKMNEKYTVQSPFNIINDILGPPLWAANSRKTLGDKMELYFQDYSLVPLFMQENYLKTSPQRSRGLDGPDKAMEDLKLMDKAASSISDGDLVDALIHGSEQHWTLMPTHAALSTVRPASFIYGQGGGWGSDTPMSFPQWLGQNSKSNKLSRALGDVQIHMRLKVSGDKNEIRQAYIPALFPHIVQPLADEGSSAVEGVMETMDEYYLSREDWDTIVELGLGDFRDTVVLKKIPTATKTAFTKKYNSRDHPIPFHRAQDLGKAPKRIADAGPAPDLEEAYDVDEEVPDEDEDKKDADLDDVSLDSFIKDKSKKKAEAAAKATAKEKKAGASTKGKKK
ncbi:DNA replication factor C, large subunit [Peniophora sp. CONT]|nr:DNA replication factor C, large subunit [Peniophora sp. CONT]